MLVCYCPYTTVTDEVLHIDELNKKKKSIDRHTTCINISDEMIDDGVSKSFWHWRKIAFASECLPIHSAEGPPLGNLYLQWGSVKTGPNQSD